MTATIVDSEEKINDAIEFTLYLMAEKRISAAIKVILQNKMKRNNDIIILTGLPISFYFEKQFLDMFL